MLLLCVRKRSIDCPFLRFYNAAKRLSLDKKSSGRRRYDDPDYRKSILQLVEEHKFNGEKKRRRKLLWSWQAVTLLVLPATTFWLGCWQVRRLKWKEGILNDIYTRMQQPTVELTSQNLGSFPDLAYRSVKITGTFIYGNELIVNMRRKKGSEGGFGDLLDTTDDGYFLITPLRLSDSGKVIMVNRGWIEKQSSHRLTDLHVDGEQIFEAIVPPTQKKRWLIKIRHETRVSDETRSTWLLKNINEMADLLNSEPVLVDAVKGLSMNGEPLGGQTSYIPRNNHLSYVITWYTLTSFMLLMWFSRYLR